MATGVQTLRPRDTLACAAEVLCHEDLAAIPITTRDGELLSIITVTDVLRAFAGALPVQV
jgi:CBS-domain-containing membrane protein